MTWISTLAICHSAGEDPRELRTALLQEGRRCLTFIPDAEPAGLARADIIIVAADLAARGEPQGLRALSPHALILALTPAAAPWADAAVHPETTLKHIADRVNAMVRLVVLETECDLRAQSLAANGLKLDDRGLKPPARIRALHIGGPSKDFGSLQDSLNQADIELRPVLRSTLALDEIENGLVDAVILDASLSPQEARELSLLLRRNSDLALSPVVVLDPRGAHSGRAPSLLSDIIRGPANPELIGVRIGQLVRESRRRRRALALLRRIRMKEAFDPATGLSTQAFLDTHLKTYLIASAETGRAFAAGVFRVSPREPLHPPEAHSMGEQIGNLVARLIRAEDTAARVSEDTIAVIFPATSETAAQGALKRIAAVLGATRFHANRYVEGITLDVDWSVFQPKAGDKPSENWIAATADLAARAR